MTLNAADGDGIGISGRIVLRAWWVDDLEAGRAVWSQANRSLRRTWLSIPELWPAEPFLEVEMSNLVLDTYLEELARGHAVQPTHLALGDGTTAPAPGNESLNREHYRTTLGQDEQDGKDRLTSTLISQNESNGDAIREIGLTDGRNPETSTLLTHVVLNDADQIDEKTSDMTVTIDYILEFRSA